MATTIAEQIKRSLERHRQQHAEQRRAVDSESPRDGFSLRYVRCRTCLQVEQWDAFMIMHGGIPHFCRCQPGDEELETFTITVPREDDE